MQNVLGTTNTMADEIPNEMKRLVVTSPGKATSVADCTVEIQTVPIPVPKSGELLIKVVAAPVNPSDYGSWYKSKPDSYPIVMGKEGCGVVVGTGGGLTTYRCPIGTKVGFVCNDSKQGSYSEYVVMDVLTGVFPMPDDVPIQDCASFMVNPYTAVGILDTALQAGSTKAILHTAAASQLGQMLVKLAPMKDMEIINVVRRDEQKEILEKLGAKHIIVTSGDDAKWKAELKAKVDELGATCAFDAVSGDMTGHLLDVMPPNGIVHLYGGLAGRAGNIDPSNLIYRKKQLKSFYLTSWIKSGGSLQMVSRMLSAGKLVNSGLKSPDGWCCTQFEDTTMEKAHGEIVKLLDSSITGKKLRIRFDGDKKE
jgi:NADPH:quinone reductase-like Zn-dependent oxidoreductase